jgi:hypothetical protein
VRAETQAPGERQQRDEEEEEEEEEAEVVEERRRRRLHPWASVAQQSISAGNVHHLAAWAPSLLFSPRLPEAKGTGRGQRTASAVWEKAQPEGAGRTVQRAAGE